MKTEHINLNIPEETKDYHNVLRAAIVKLVRYCQHEQQQEDIKILDVGCGRGELLYDLTCLGTSVQGVDMEDRCVLLSQEFAPVHKGSIYDLQNIFPPNSFEIVIASHVLEHLENPQRAIDMMKNVSAKYLIIAVPNLAEFRNLRWRQSDPGFVNRGHKSGWDAAHLNTFLHYSCGLNIVKWQPDRVYVHRFLRPFLRPFSLLTVIQDRWLPLRLPYQAHSLIALCTK